MFRAGGLRRWPGVWTKPLRASRGPSRRRWMKQLLLQRSPFAESWATSNSTVTTCRSVVVTRNSTRSSHPARFLACDPIKCVYCGSFSPSWMETQARGSWEAG
jgi:hypothetical protein